VTASSSGESTANPTFGGAFASEVQRFFPVAKDAPVAAFADLAPRYPVFELLPVDDARR
jgi:hypothetical protein